MKKPKRKKPTLLSVPLADIEINGGTQTRVAIDQPTVDTYVAAIEAGAELPPPEIYGPDFAGCYWPGDGFHRLLSYSTLDHAEVVCAVRPGGYREALAHSLAANDEHGLRRSRLDKVNAIRMALAEWPDLSTAALAEMCAVSREMVDRERSAARTGVARSNGHEYEDTLDGGSDLGPEPAHRVGLDGKKYPASLDREAVARRARERAAEEALPENFEPDQHLWDAEGRGALAPFSPLVDVAARPLPEEIRSEVDYRGIPTWAELLKGRGIIPVVIAHDDNPDTAPVVLVNRRFAIDAIQTMEPPLKLFRAKPISPRQADKIAGSRAQAAEERRRKEWLRRVAAAVIAECRGKSIVPPFYKRTLSGVIFTVAQLHPAAAEWTAEIFHDAMGPISRAQHKAPGEELVMMAKTLVSPALIALLHVAALSYDTRENGKTGILVAAAIRDLGVAWPDELEDEEEGGEGETA